MNHRRLVALLALVLPTSSLMPAAPAMAASPPTIAIGDNAVYEGNGGLTPGRVSVTLSDPQPADTLVSFTTVDGSATAGTDYTALHGRVKIAAGKTSAVIAVKVAGDNAEEGDETLAVTLTSATAAGVVISDNTALITIRDDDTGAPWPTLAIGDSTVYEGDGGFTTARVSLTLSEPQPADLLVSFTTVDGSATSGSDYAGRHGRVRIRAGKTAAAIGVKTTGDTIDESDETLGISVTGTNAPGVTVSDNAATITIRNDEPPPLPLEPDVPTAFAAEPGPLPRYLTATWSAPLVGTALDGYDLEVTRGASTNVVADVSSPYSFGCGLASITDTCTMRVRAFNGAGPGPWSDPVTASTWAPPDAPPNLRTLDGSAVEWDLPTSDRPVEQYWVQKSTNDGLSWTHVTTTTNRYASTTCTICKVRVAAQSEIGIGGYSTIDFAWAPPTPPTALTVVRDTVNPIFLHISWGVPLIATPPIDEYIVMVNDFTSPITLPGITTLTVDVRMRNTDAALVTVYALNAAGMSTPAAFLVPAA